MRSSSSEERKNGARSNEGIEELGDDGCCLSSNARLSLLQSGHFFSVVEVLGAVVEREREREREREIERLLLLLLLLQQQNKTGGE